jgi:hypothetical protein
VDVAAADAVSAAINTKGTTTNCLAMIRSSFPRS